MILNRVNIVGLLDRFKKTPSSLKKWRKESASSQKNKKRIPNFSFQFNKIDWKSIKSIAQLETSLRQLFSPKKYPGWFAFRFTPNHFYYLHVMPFNISLKNETQKEEIDESNLSQPKKAQNDEQKEQNKDTDKLNSNKTEDLNENSIQLILEPSIKSEGPTSELVNAVNESHDQANIPQWTIAAWGEIPYTENDVNEVKKLINTLNLKHYHCTSILGLFETQLFEIEKPPVTKEEMATAVRWKVKEMVEMPLEEMVIDTFEIVPPSSITSYANRAPQIYVTVANKNTINDSFKKYSQVGIPLEVIDIDELAQRNIANLFEDEKKGFVLLSFTEEGGLLTISYQNELYFYRRLDISLDQLLELKDADYDRRYKVLDRITTELQRSLDKVERQYSFISLNKIYISPLPAEIGLENYLHSNLYITTETLDLSKKLDLSIIEADQLENFQLKFFHLIGACLRDLQ